MSNSTEKERVKWLAALHAFTADFFELDDPHPLLHQLAITEFEVKSMAELTANELRMLQHRLKEHQINWAKVEALGVTRVPEMTEAQKSTAKKLIKELKWSSEYVDKMVVQRYGMLDWRYLTGRKAFAFVGYLIKRRKQQRKVK